mmetsp:Transcript_22375/g.38620  ORF Transcript_22375/g.38620 Transcript_22375/m.38620 type:complete len:345 (+) Transcript_22375:104-1138(+)
MSEIDLRFWKYVDNGDVNNAKQIYESNQAGINVNWTNPGHMGATSLMRAAWNEDVEMVSWLLDATNADVKQRNDHGSSVLHYSAYNKDDNITQLLLDRGADPAVKNNDESSALIYASVRGSIKVVQLLAQYSKMYINHKDKKGNTALISSTYQNNGQITETLLNYGAGIQESGRDGEHILTRAARNGNDQVVSVLLNRLHGDSELDACAGEALIVASKLGRDKVVRVLLDFGVNVESKNLEGENALLLATRNVFTQVISVLLEYGANPEVKYWFGETPLHMVVKIPSAEQIMRNFLAHGANVYSKTPDGDACLMLATRQKFDSKVESLLQKESELAVFHLIAFT